MKRDVGIGYTIMRKIHYNVMRFRETMGVDEAEVTYDYETLIYSQL
jgi:hypothetical protein